MYNQCFGGQIGQLVRFTNTGLETNTLPRPKQEYPPLKSKVSVGPPKHKSAHPLYCVYAKVLKLRLAPRW